MVSSNRLLDLSRKEKKKREKMKEKAFQISVLLIGAQSL